MSSPRCAVGCGNLQNTLLVCGKFVKTNNNLGVLEEVTFISKHKKLK